jgi:methyl-accepting chemotaxis protein
VEQTISAIEQLSEQLNDVDTAINRLITGSKSIEAVLGEISSIADQTNLLALNAAIEAARAGEHGRGFAVVADEVRALALRTQQSTEEVNKLLGQLQSESDLAVTSMKKGTTLSQGCVELASETGGALAKITSEVSELAAMNEQIATAIEEQSVVTEEINQNIVSISDMTGESEEHSKEAVALSEGLLKNIKEQQNLVSQFRR